MRKPEEANSGRKRLYMVALGLVALLAIGGVVGFGYYEAFVAPTKVLAARVDNQRYTQGDLVKRLRMQSAIASFQDRPLDFGRAPFETLMEMAQAQVIRRSAPSYNIKVGDADIEASLRGRFAPFIPEGQDIRPGQIEVEYKERYLSFLEETHLSDSDYREIVEEQVYRSKLRERLGEQVPSVADQVEVEWIVIPVSQGAQGTPGQLADQARDRLRQGEDFGTVARSTSSDRTYADKEGYVGWVPEGAFPHLDGILFGDDETEPIAHGEISEPAATRDQALYVVKVKGGPELREISDKMRERLKDVSLETWLDEQTAIGTREGWWEVKFDSEIYRWVIDQVRAASPPTPTPPPDHAAG